jgi:4-diphosphocytidyl-2-C-methyl-D-erythritol kinase
VRKRIPLQAGLGGGSADAAAALHALRRLWRARMPETDIEAIGGALGADVPYFLCGGTALGLGRGDEIYPLADLPSSPVVLAYPKFGVATAEAFRWFDADGGAAESCRAGRRATGREAAVWRPDAAGVVNDLEACVIRRHPDIGGMLERLREAGATVASMSGSGSAVYGLFADAARASRAASRLGGGGWSALATRTLTRRQSTGALVSAAPRRIN